MRKLTDYKSIVGTNVIEELKILGKQVKGQVVQNINSTRSGGGVAEILTNLIPLMQEMGVEAHWDVISGSPEFFRVTKKIHNALHGRKERITNKMLDLFRTISLRNLAQMNIYGDLVIIHDPQPIMLIKKKQADNQTWLWRCHIDISRAERHIFDFLKRWIIKYDSLIFSSPLFSRRFPLRQFLISPSIDPLSNKNREISPQIVDKVLDKYKLDREKPMITQISRFDYLKDPLGVIDTFHQVKKYHDCQLILAGNRASDDPETDKVLANVRKKAADNPDIHILLIPPEHNDIDINALQRASTVIVQKSIREGFGLVVSEALWKAKPVVASAVGGIPLQVEHGLTGLLCRSVEGAAYRIKQLLSNPEYARWLGKNGKEHIRQNFLLTRHLRDYLLLAIVLSRDQDIIHL